MEISTIKGVKEEKETLYGGKIQFGLKRNGGRSSWSADESSVRLAWYRDDGGFDPFSSSELSFWGLCELVIASAEKDALPRTYLNTMAHTLLCSLRRSPFHSTCNNILQQFGYNNVSTINSGCLIGSINVINNKRIIVITVDATADGYFQEIFENDLRKLIDKLRHLLPNKSTLIFPAGGDLILPDWFLEFCRNNGVEIIIIEGIDENFITSKLEDIC